MNGSESENIDRLMAEFLAGTLTPEGREDLYHVLRENPARLRELADYLQMDGMLRGLPQPDADLVMRQIEARLKTDTRMVDRVLASTERKHGGTSRAIPIASRRSIVPLATAAALFVTAAVLSTIFLAPKRQAPSAPLVEQDLGERMAQAEADLRRERDRVAEIDVERERLEAAKAERKGDAEAELRRALALVEEKWKKAEEERITKEIVRNRTTVTADPVFEEVRGEAFVVQGSTRVAALSGETLAVGAKVETSALESRVVFRYPDTTRITMEGAGVVASDGERRLRLERGELSAVVASEPIVCVTPQAEASATRAQMRVVVADVTRVSVIQGEARLTRLSDRAVLDVKADHYAVIAASGELAAVALIGQGDKRKQQGGHPKVDPKKVDAAIARGIASLRGKAAANVGGADSLELILWTFIHAEIHENDPDRKRMMKAMLDAELSRTYNVSLQAMILEEVQRQVHQERIWKCAQFLVDNESGGLWGYGAPTTYGKLPGGTATGGKKGNAVASKTKGERVHREKPPVTARFPVTKTRDGVPHDNSNAQYAALGMRACHDAGIVFPSDFIDRVMKYWRDAQCDAADQAKKGTASGGGTYPAAGWYYLKGGIGYGSMTVGGVGSLCILDYIKEGEQAKSWKRDKDVLEGLAWMAENFTVKENPKIQEALGVVPGAAYLYYLYGLERVGALYGTEWIGKHEWYPEGANQLLQSQRADGSWDGGWGHADSVTWDTCYAILFLKRATRPLDGVISEDVRRPRDVADDSRAPKEEKR